MPESEPREFVIGPLRITIEHRRTCDDEGPSLRVFGQVGNRERQVLRFDCFVADPHYHYDPDGRDEVHHMRDEGIDDTTEWTLHRLERNLRSMIRRAGYGSLADRVDESLVAEHVPSIHEGLFAPAVS
jgi:hypothetical protein